ncbi:unnamed protein product [Allacma fusca]|uniref:Uncharacterized protein n=1 Tax=Allacma fusca TaxID=39272 RepID=A0A8J2PZ17_9HEXA|nr:unnamed protein product [Allacma fusca]
MSWRNKLSGVLLIIAFNLLIYFARSFPVLTHYQTNPELGPFFEGDIKGNPLDRNGIPEEIFRWKKGIFRFYVQDDYRTVRPEVLQKGKFRNRNIFPVFLESG